MTTKNRIAQLEKQKPQVKITWKDFIAIANDDGTFAVDVDAETKAAWDEFMAKSVAEFAEDAPIAEADCEHVTPA